MTNRIAVPDGMIEAANEAWDHFGGIGIDARVRVTIEAALRWQSEHPPVPTEEQVCEIMVPFALQTPTMFVMFTERWIRRAYDAPDPAEEAVKDLLLCAGTGYTYQEINERIRASYRRGEDRK